MLRTVLAIVGGLALAFAIVFVTDALFHALFATGAPPGNPGDADALRAYVAAQPVAGLVTIVLGWAAAAFAGAAVASGLARRGAAPGYAVVALFLLATAANFALVEHPVAMVAGAIAAICVAGWLGTRIGARLGRPLQAG